MSDMPMLRSKLYDGEDAYFKQNPRVTGMAAEDGKVILNPYSTLKPEEQKAVYLNEAARLYMRQNGVPKVALTDEQRATLAGTTYADAGEDDRSATILARIISGDPSAGAPTKEQVGAAREISARMGGQGYGQRQDGTEKGRGFLGELRRPDGNVSTELSIGVNIGGKEIEIPTLVPTLSKKEIQHLLNGGEPTPAIIRKAVMHAKERIGSGKSPFAGPEDDPDAQFAAGFGDAQ